MLGEASAEVAAEYEYEVGVAMSGGGDPDLPVAARPQRVNAAVTVVFELLD